MPFTWGKKQQDRLIIDFQHEAKKEALRVYFRLNGMVELESLEGVALLALVKSGRGYNPLNGSKFWAYASKSIENSLLDYVRKQ